MSIIAPQVCELDIIFNFEKAYFMLDEFLLGGEVQETSKKNVLKAIAAQDLLQEVRLSSRVLECLQSQSQYTHVCLRMETQMKQFLKHKRAWWISEVYYYQLMLFLIVKNYFSKHKKIFITFC